MNFIQSFLSEGMDQRPAYGFSHRIRAAVEMDQITPSPLDYHAERVVLGASSKAFSFGHRPKTNYVNDSDTPGPGEYFISEEAPRRRKSGYSFSSRPTVKRPRSHTPGPKYLPESGGSSQRGFSFGHRPKFGRRISDTPGPGEYDTEKFLFKGTPAYTFGVKNHKRGQNDFFRNATPSAASYRPETAKAKNAPAYSFGTKSRGRIFVEIDSPGPGEYDTHRSPFRSYQKGFSFGLRVSLWIIVGHFERICCCFSFRHSSSEVCNESNLRFAGSRVENCENNKLKFYPIKV